MSTPDGPHRCRAMLLLCSLDLPARALVSNMKAYNGEYSCCTCRDKGDNTVGASAGVRYWPYHSSCILRTADDVKKSYEDAVKDQTAVSYNEGCIIVM